MGARDERSVERETCGGVRVEMTGDGQAQADGVAGVSVLAGADKVAAQRE